MDSLGNTLANLLKMEPDWERLPAGVPLSVLDPYVPLFRAPKVPGMDRASTRAEADEVRAIAREHGLEVVE